MERSTQRWSISIAFVDLKKSRGLEWNDVEKVNAAF